MCRRAVNQAKSKIIFRLPHWPKNPNSKKIADLKAYHNLKLKKPVEKCFYCFVLGESTALFLLMHGSFFIFMFSAWSYQVNICWKFTFWWVSWFIHVALVATNFGLLWKCLSSLNSFINDHLYKMNTTCGSMALWLHSSTYLWLFHSMVLLPYDHEGWPFTLWSLGVANGKIRDSPRCQDPS